MNAIDGVLAKIIFHKASKFSRTGSHYLIGKLTNGMVIKGEMDAPKENENYRFYGEIKSHRGRDEQAFEFESFEVLVDQSVAGQVQYLKNYVDGLGFVKSQALVDHFGPDTLSILRESPERAIEVGGITEKISESIAEHFEEVGKRRRFDPVAFAKLIDLFSAFRVSKNTLKTLVNLYGSNAPDVILANPYMLLSLPRMGWKTVDSFALTVAKYDPLGIERHASAYEEAFQQLSLDGHTHGTLAELSGIAGGLLGIPANSAAITKLIGENKVVTWPGEDRASTTFALAKLAEAEKRIALLLGKLSRDALPLPAEVNVDGLDPAQVDAIRVLEESGVAILCGPPGTGKSYTFTKFLAELIKEGVDPGAIRVVAPTGKAAKRVSELLEKHLPPGTIQSTTIHKALAPTPAQGEKGIPADAAKHGRGRDGFYFAKNAASPIEASLIVLEEASMVDVKLGASFLDAVAPGTRLIIVGDQNQLPPVGPGAFLRDAMAAGVPTVELTKILRSDGGGRVVKACHAIKDGFIPEPGVGVDLPVENWVHCETSDQNEIAAKIVELHEMVKRKGKTDPIWGMQVVSPQNGKLPIACANLNRLLAACLNPNATPDNGAADSDDSSTFFVGDKVVRTSNGMAPEMRRRDGKHSISDEVSMLWRGNKYILHSIPIVNGDMGEIVDTFDDAKGKLQVVVRFKTPDRLCCLPYSSCDLIQAYALTCHKAQGSGFPYVIVPVHEGFYWDHRKGLGLFSREWLYTAISRAETLLVTVGQFSAIRQAVGRQTLHIRRTKLEELIREELPALETEEAR